MNSSEQSATPNRRSPASGGSVTVAYSIVDDKEWGATNPLRYEHNGLKAHTVAVYDAFERVDRYREELERLRDLVCTADVESIDAVLSESQNAKRSEPAPQTNEKH